MRDELLTYYESELRHLRKAGAAFAREYPRVASRLELEPTRCADPHVERLIEALAFLTARIRLKIDDEFPEIAESLLDVLFPHLLRPVPAISIAQFRLDPRQGRLTSPLRIPRGSVLNYRYGPEAGREDAPGGAQAVPCKFRTCYETTVWPLGVSEVRWSSPASIPFSVRDFGASRVLQIELKCSSGISFPELDVTSLQFSFNGEPSLYESLCNQCKAILVRDPDGPSTAEPLVVPTENLRPLGFSESEALLPYPNRSFGGYRLLQEYFAFPEKFLFFDLLGLEKLQLAVRGRRAEVSFLISPPQRYDHQSLVEPTVSRDTVRLGCTPIVNLFTCYAEPIRVDHTRSEYLVVPDGRRPTTTEIFSIDEVSTVDSESQELEQLDPLYTVRHRSRPTGLRWHAARRGRGYGEARSTDVYLSLAGSLAGTVRLEPQTLTVRCTCSNRDWPANLAFGREDGDFDMQERLPVDRIIAFNPTPARRPQQTGRALWNLISHLSPNHLSLVQEGKEALQEILSLSNVGHDAAAERQIAGISRLASSPQVADVRSEYGASFARGSRVEIEFDEEKFVGADTYLFASVLERFLGEYVSMNSFTQLVARTRQRKEPMRIWPPRAGCKVLI